ncbi:MAG: hypothetical protein KHY69_08855, partial [Streptococcus salivarius]|nr:hypothetical protein [Streptococcus salivarius]
TTRAEEAAAAPSGLKEMQDCHPAVVYQTKKSLSGAFLYSKDINSYKNTKSVLIKTKKLYIIALKVSVYLM